MSLACSFFAIRCVFAFAGRTLMQILLLQAPSQTALNLLPPFYRSVMTSWFGLPRRLENGSIVVGAAWVFLLPACFFDCSVLLPAVISRCSHGTSLRGKVPFLGYYCGLAYGFGVICTCGASSGLCAIPIGYWLMGSFRLWIAWLGLG